MDEPVIKTDQLLLHLRGGDLSDAFEAAKSLSSLRRAPVKQMIDVLNEAPAVHNREAAAYALSWLFRRKGTEHLEALINVFNNIDESPVVRAQALEGFGLQRKTRRHKLWPAIERAILQGLADEAVEVRFWACYAAGTLRVRSALPRLRELVAGDETACPHWWSISDEAADAVEWIFGRETPMRTPVA